MYVVACDLSGHDLQFVFCGDLPQQVAHMNCHFPGQYRFAIFWDPHDMQLEVTLRVRSQPIMSHATTLHQNLLRLKARPLNARNMNNLVGGRAKKIRRDPVIAIEELPLRVADQF